MSGETIITVIGALGADPELRFTPAGAAVCNFSVGTNARTFDRQTNEWKDGPTTWYNCSAWRDLAENVAETLQKGMRVVVHGALTNREYETRDGGKGRSLEINVDAIGPDLRWATARVTRATAGGSRPQQQPGGYAQGPAAQGPPPGQQQHPQQQQDPWGAPPQRQQQDPWGPPAGQSDEPPF